ncbi:hypothetical protein SSCG_00966 [Streptomyces clavuligerus]|nr:hypothetical protein SSCG_00966 [Streptomyces clavuligerus]
MGGAGGGAPILTLAAVRHRNSSIRTYGTVGSRYRVPRLPP